MNKMNKMNQMNKMNKINKMNIRVLKSFDLVPGFSPINLGYFQNIFFSIEIKIKLKTNSHFDLELQPLQYNFIDVS